jgi:hypothetical protein
MSRKVMTAWFAIVGIPAMVALGWLISRSDAHSRSILVLDVPADVDVVIDDHPLKACVHEYRAPDSCKQAPRPGFSRRYAWSVIRGQPIVVSASRGAQRLAPRTIPIAVLGPTPHLRLDDVSFDWVDVGGVEVNHDGAVFVDHGGRVVGPVGPSDPD